MLTLYKYFQVKRVGERTNAATVVQLLALPRIEFRWTCYALTFRCAAQFRSPSSHRSLLLYKKSYDDDFDIEPTSCVVQSQNNPTHLIPGGFQEHCRESRLSWLEMNSYFELVSTYIEKSRSIELNIFFTNAIIV